MSVILRKLCLDRKAPYKPATLRDTKTLAVRLSEKVHSTGHSEWVEDGHKGAIVVQSFPDENGEAPPHVFVDTVFVRLVVPSYTTGVKDPKTGKVKETYHQCDPAASSNAVLSLFGTIGTYAGLAGGPDTDTSIQSYYISTCNLPVALVYRICQEIKDGQHFFNGKEIELVRVDLTTNVFCAVRPEELGVDIPGWVYKDNRQYVGECCHTYVTEYGNEEETENGEGEEKGVETKIYDKARFMLEAGKVSESVYDSLPNLLHSPQQNIREGFKNPLAHAQGFSRVETRFFTVPESLEEAVDKHLSYIPKLIDAYGVITPLQRSYDLLLHPMHYATMVVLEDRKTGTFKWTFCRWVNHITGKGSGFSGTGEESALHCLNHRTIGGHGINLHYVIRDLDNAVSVVAGAKILPDNLHRGNLIAISEGNKSKAGVVVSGYKWKDAGINIRLSLSNTNGKKRNLKTRNVGDSEVPELRNEAAIEKAQAKAAKQAIKRAEKARQKVLDAVETNKYKNPPSDWRAIEHISKLAAIAKPICTRYAPDESDSHNDYVVLVGKKWFRANTKLDRLLDAKPAPPFTIKVWDSGSEFDGNKIWGVELSKFE